MKSETETTSNELIYTSPYIKDFEVNEFKIVTANTGIESEPADC